VPCESMHLKCMQKYCLSGDGYAIKNVSNRLRACYTGLPQALGEVVLQAMMTRAFRMLGSPHRPNGDLLVTTTSLGLVVTSSAVIIGFWRTRPLQIYPADSKRSPHIRDLEWMCLSL
jgi:hypothetical protein